jgi:hypothetical protein
MKSQKEKIHKFKNKHTGEVITTPYLAEAEEYRSNINYIEVNMKKDFYKKKMQEHFAKYEKAVEAGDKVKIDYHMKEYLNYQTAFKSAK